MSFLFTVAWRNLWRHRRRSLITATAMAVGVALCMATICFQDGMFELMFDVMVEQQLGHAQVHHPDYPGKRALQDTVPHASETLAALERVEGTEAVAGKLQGFALLGGSEKSTGALLVGLDPARERVVSKVEARVRSGRFLADAPAGEIVLGVKLAEELKLALGDEVVAVTQSADGSLGNALYTVVGTARTGNAQLDRGGAWMHLADLQSLLVLEDQVHAVTVLTTDADAIDAWVGRARAAVGSDTLEVLSWSEAAPQSAQMIQMQDLSAVIVLTIVFGAAGFGILNTMMMSVFERTRELGVLKALGLRPARMVGLVLVESVLLASLSAVIGLALGGLLDAWLVTKGLDFSASLKDGFSMAGIVIDPVVKGSVRWQSVASIVAALYAVSLLASLWPGIRAARLEPVAALRADG